MSQSFTVYIPDADVKQMLTSNQTVGKPPVEIHARVNAPTEPEDGTQLRLLASDVRVPDNGGRDFDVEILGATPGSSGTTGALSVGMQLAGHMIADGVGMTPEHPARLTVK